MDAVIYNQKGAKAGELTLPEFFATPWRSDLMFQAVLSEQKNARQGTAHTKDRGEVRGGGKKPWQRKGTGRARHGSIRSPIWRGGGITHGPEKEKNYSVKLNRKVRRKALAMALTRKFTDGQILFLEAFTLPAPKSASAKELLNGLAKIKDFNDISVRRNNSATIALAQDSVAVKKSFRNFGSVVVVESRNLTAGKVLGSKYLVIIDPKAAIAQWAKKMSS
jgi:large subunit ribosomal protein L4